MKRYTSYAEDAKAFTGGFGVTHDVQVNYQLVGEWSRANFMMRQFPHRVSQAINLATREMAYRYRKKVISHILNRGADLGWPRSSSEKYEQFKAKHATKAVEDQLQFFGVLLENIKAYKHGRMGWSVGIKDGVVNPRMEEIRKGKTLSVSEYAGVLEHGSTKMNIPPRPLWTPSYRDIGGNKELIRLIRLNIRAKFPSVRLKLPTYPKAAGTLPTM